MMYHIVAIRSAGNSWANMIAHDHPRGLWSSNSACQTIEPFEQKCRKNGPWLTAAAHSSWNMSLLQCSTMTPNRMNSDVPFMYHTCAWSTYGGSSVNCMRDISKCTRMLTISTAQWLGFRKSDEAKIGAAWLAQTPDAYYLHLSRPCPCWASKCKLLRLKWAPV